MMKAPVVIIGMGEMGAIFACGFLRNGHPVYPVLRGTDMAATAASMVPPALVVVAVGEDDLSLILETIPDAWSDRLALIQNELLPRQWQQHGIEDPTVAVIWFDKKRGRDCKVVLPTPVCGPRSSLMIAALEAEHLPCHAISADDMLYELVRKNLYILTINIAGLRTGGTVSHLWSNHRKLAEEVSNEILDIQEWLCQTKLPRGKLIAGMIEGFEGDPDHICTGRSASARLQRALRHAWEARISTPILQEIADDLH